MSEDSISEVTGTSGAPAETGTTTAQTSWSSSLDKESFAWAQNRGLDKLDTVDALGHLVQANRNLESKLGVPGDRILKLPEHLDGDDMESVYDRLGRPKTADDYTLPMPEDQPADENFVGWAKETFHKLGLSDKQASRLAEAWNSFAASQAEAAETAFEEKVSQGVDALKKKFGAAYDQNRKTATRARNELGVTDEEIDALAATIGVERTVELFYNIGSRVLEDSFQSGGKDGADFVRTPEQARQELETRKNDKDFRQKLINGDASATKEWQKLILESVAS